MNLTYCSSGDAISVPWRDGGLSRCFLSTVSPSVAGGWLFVAGIVQMASGRRKLGKSMWNSNYPRRFMRYVTVQVLVSLLIVLISLVDLILKASLHPRRLFGYTILSDGVFIVSWLFSVFLLNHERARVTPRVRRHGVALLGFFSLTAVGNCLAFLGWNNRSWFWQSFRQSEERTTQDVVDLTLFCLNFTGCVVAMVMAIVSPLFRNQKLMQTLLLNEEDDRAEIGNRGEEEEDSNQKSTFSNLWAKCKQLAPYLWPKKNRLLQLAVLVCLISLALGRVVNVFVPIYYREIDWNYQEPIGMARDIILNPLVSVARILNSLTPSVNNDSKSTLTVDIGDYTYSVLFPWQTILIYVGLRFLQGGGTGSMAFLSNMRTMAWTPVQQYTSRFIQIDLLKHLHGLSLRWHLSRKTGEVLRIVDRGTNSVNNLLNYVLFSILPTIVDIGIAVVYFGIAFDVYFALIVFMTMLLYLLFTIGLTEWRTKFRRDMNLMDNESRQKAVDSLINFETVKYYGAESYEVCRFTDSILGYQVAERKSIFSLVLLNCGQNIIITCGLLAGGLLCAKRVSEGIYQVGDFVLFISYVLQLYQPLNFFGTYYRMIQQAFIDMENMFDLLEEKQEVVDIPNAPCLQITDKQVTFENVTFSYVPGKVVLQNVSFVVNPGETLALVGPSGAGKSTVMRLLFRFYDLPPGGGRILIDGQDISKVSQLSLRHLIGVVPQDTVLFNGNIRYNIRYGRAGATDSEVDEAARTADIHDRILTFPEGYKTVVGERGLKLSGGEKQRVAIARTVLKAPSIVLLDEATSALDTHTERNIQASFSRICAHKTTLVVAHRLSTIIHAHQILVLKDGSIVEKGRHEELLVLDGLYASMWKEQLQAAKEGGSPIQSNTEL